MELSGQYHASASLTPENKTCAHWIGEWLGPSGDMDVL